ncbi:MAG: LysR family transcriptional regulator [Clostridium sp.]|nr:LysR family transcriptional regulator [Clostridium sp.]
MEIRVLKYFLTVAKEGSITGAANALHLTQPTLSRQIKNLEKELGHKLLIRTNHNVSLTPEGMMLRKRAEEILDMVEKTQVEFNSIKNFIAGEIYIGSGETEVVKHIAEVIKEIRADYPDIVFHVHSANHEDVIEKLDKGLLDFGVVMESCYLSKYDYLTLPETDSWGVVMRKDSKLAKKEFITLDDLIGLPLILSRKVFRENSNENEFNKWFNKNKEHLDIAATHNLFFNAAVLAQEGAGYVLTLNNLANTSKTSCLCFRPLKPVVKAHWHLIWKKHQVFSPASKLFLDRIQTKFTQD